MRASRSDPRSSGAVFFAVFFAAAIVLGGPATSTRATGVAADDAGVVGSAAAQPVSLVLDGSTRPAARTLARDAEEAGRALISSDTARLDGGLDGEGPLGRLGRPSLRLIVGAPRTVRSGMDRPHARAAELSRLAYASNLTEAQAGELAARSTAPPAHLI